MKKSAQKITPAFLKNLLKKSAPQTLAMRHYPSRGQSAIQEIYQTKIGRLFLKQTSERNLIECQINKYSGTLAEREYWAANIAMVMGITMPIIWLLDKNTTVQNWINWPDANLFKSRYGRLTLHRQDVFNHALFDWTTGQIDRHDANYLYNFSNEHITLIDSAFSFLKYDGSMPEYLSYFEASSPNELKAPVDLTILKDTLHISPKTLIQLAPLRGREERFALLQRQQSLIPVKCLQDILNLYRRTS